MAFENPQRLQISDEFTRTIVSKLETERGIHAETAISAAAWMAGTFVLRSCRLPIANLAPGAPIFSDAVNEQGPKVLESVDKTLARMKVAVDPKTLDYIIPEGNHPNMKLMEVQSLLDPSFQVVLKKHGVNDEEAAHAAAVSAAVLIEKTAGVLDPRIGYMLVVQGLVEGCKTVPHDPERARSAAEAPA